MNTTRARAIANSLTWARVFSAIPITILIALDLHGWVFGVYVAAALTDFLDGLFARRAQPARYGGAFDAYADIFFALMTLVWMTWLFPGFFERYAGLLVLPYLLLQAVLFYLRFRNPGMIVPHLVSGKLGTFAFNLLLPVYIVLGDIPAFVIAVFALAIAAKLHLIWHLVGTRARAGTTGTT